MTDELVKDETLNHFHSLLSYSKGWERGEKFLGDTPK